MHDAFSPGAVRFDETTGLVPAVVQDSSDGTVLMLGYMSAGSLERTLDSGRVTFYSRSRGRLWEKGQTSGNTLSLVSIATDCDGDALLVRATPAGPTCHTGARSCFGASSTSPSAPPPLGAILSDLGTVIAERDSERPTGSYTTELLDAGVLRIAQKVAEEAVETALAAAAAPGRVAEESADLLYHLLVLWRAAGVRSTDVSAALQHRRTGS